MHDRVRGNHDELKQIAALFGQEADAAQRTLASLRQRKDTLQGGDWVGQAARKFYDEMDASVLPALVRLQRALAQAQQVTQKISARLRQAEADAAAVLKDREAFGGQANEGGGTGTGAEGGANGGGGGSSGGPGSAQPRIYVVNGINNQGEGLPELRDYLIQHGYDPKQVRLTPSVYDTNLQGGVANLQGTQLSGTNLQGTQYGGWRSPIDWLTGAGASAVNTMTGAGASTINTVTGAGASVVRGGAGLVNSTIGVGQVAVEYVTGGSTQTARIDRFIQEDLARNPLAPGQSVILMGHSGGGAITANLAQRYTAEGIPVSGVVNMGSPVFNRDGAAEVTHVTDIRASGDPVVKGTIRSNEARYAVPVAVVPGPGLLPRVATGVAFDQAARDRSGNFTEFTTRSGGHSSYWTTPELAEILNQEYGLGLNTRP